MIKKHEANYTGMSKDLASDLQSKKYFDAKNIRILATDQKSSFAVTNEAGNELVFDIPEPVFDFLNTRITYSFGSETKSLPYSATLPTIPRCELEEEYMIDQNTAKVSGVQVIIGTKELRDSALIVTTDDNGFDCFWELTNLNGEEFDLVLLYMGDLGLSKNNLVQVIYNYENSVIEKIYIVDGIHQIRYFNIRQSIENGDSINLIDVSSQSVDTVSTFTLSQPKINSVISGGSHTAGMIQYAYGLYILNGAQTTTSPISELTSIDKGVNLGGGEVNEVLGKSVLVSIENIDTKFTHVILYSIKYTSYNEIPEISIVVDKEIDNFQSLSITDDGTSQNSISLSSFAFLGSSPIIPQHIATKDNRLFPVNITEQVFDIDLDFRAYSFNSSQNCQVIDNAYLDSNGTVNGVFTSVTAPDYNLIESHDAINADYNTYKYQSDGVTLGASGKYIELEITQSSLSDNEAKNLQFLKDREIYRIGIKLYNQRGQTTDPFWISDIQAPEGNLEGNYNQLRVTLTSEFNTWLQDESNFASPDDKPVGYKILRADRTLLDQTIFAQGMINPMIANYPNTISKRTSLASRKEAVNSGDSIMMPSVCRMFETLTPFVGCKDYHETNWEQMSDSSFADLGKGPKREGFKAAPSSNWRAQNFQQNRLMQFFSPEVIFRDNEIDGSYKLNIVGLSRQNYVANWAAETNPVSWINSIESKFINGINSSTPNVSVQVITESGPSFFPESLMDKGFFAPTNTENNRALMQMYRSFQGDFKKATGNTVFDVYGTPEITEAGDDFKRYNNDDSFKYVNHLKNMLIDKYDEDDTNPDSSVSIKGTNTIGSRCITFAEGPDDLSLDSEMRKSIEDIYSISNIQDGSTDGMLVAEFIKEESVKYVGGIYGGMSNEAKSVSSYIEIGEFTKIDTNSVFIDSPGDTFVNTFTFFKMAKDPIDQATKEQNVVCEIVSIKVETTIDLKNRNDLSLGDWDSNWFPQLEEYEKYNNVYSQQPTLIKSSGTGNKIKKVKSFDGRLMASKEKIPGEFIDSWTDFLENETMDLDGKYGPINAVVNLKDEIFCLQDTAVAHIAINPRVQTTGQDGISLELGTGGILHDYKYKSTTIGCLNKWGVVTSENAFYFIDLINKGIMTFDGARVARLSDLQGFHHELNNRMNYSSLISDNPVLGTGVSVGYNPVNADVYFSFLQPKDNFTLGFNEKVGSFISYYDYVPAWYINKGSTLITTDSTNSQLWEHFKGNPNSFYGKDFKSSITLHVAPEGNEIILNSASYKCELLDSSGNELPNQSLTGVRVYNDYQDSGVVDLVMRQNMFKKFRNWKINFPRQANTRDRVRSAWGFAEFVFENKDGKKLILHDMSIFYTQY